MKDTTFQDAVPLRSVTCVPPTFRPLRSEVDIDRYIAYSLHTFSFVRFFRFFSPQDCFMSTLQLPSPVQTKRIAAIDLGTNSFHALIVDLYQDGRFDIVDTLKEMVLLAEEGVTDTLSEAAMDRGVEALRRIKTLTDHREVEVKQMSSTSIRCFLTPRRVLRSKKRCSLFVR